VDLDLVEDSGRECELRDAGAADEDVLFASGLLRAGRCGLALGTAWICTGVLATEDEDRHAVVMVAAPAFRELEGPAASDHRAGVHHLAVDPGPGERVLPRAASSPLPTRA
jgi:hypothetical protein